MLFGKELPPAAYTIDAAHRGLTDEVAERAVQSCDQNRFAFVPNALTPDDFRDFTQGAFSYASRVDSEPLTVGDSTKLVAHFSEEERGSVATKPFFDLVAGAIIDPLWRAACRVESPRMKFPDNKITVGAFQLNTYEPGGKIGRHYDGEQGVAAVLGIEGVGHTKLTRLTRCMVRLRLATLDVMPGDLLLMPAVGPNHGGMFDQAWHEVINTTPGGGRRASFAAAFGPQPQEPAKQK